MKTGALAATDSIFYTYPERFNETNDFLLAHLTDIIDYNSNQKFTMDREDKPWFSTAEERQAYWLQRIRYDLINLRLSNSDVAANIETLTKRYTNLESQWSKMNSEDRKSTRLNSSH